MTISQGAQANRNGKVFENMMIPIFEAAGFVVLSERELKKKTDDELREMTRYIVRNASYMTIYNSEGKTEFVIVDASRRVRVEAKYQAAAGSVDEKYPYMLLNGILKYPESEIIFVVDGGGYKPGAREWLRRQIENDWLDFRESGKDIKLMTIAEFMNWFNHEFA